MRTSLKILNVGAHMTSNEVPRLANAVVRHSVQDGCQCLFIPGDRPLGAADRMTGENEVGISCIEFGGGCGPFWHSIGSWAHFHSYM